MSELRTEPRQRTLKGAVIVFNERRSTLNCTVRNLSVHGAQIRVATVVGIPDSFELRLTDGARHQCSVAWRRSGELGVKFI